MKTRKIISLILTVCMVMSIITPAFADESQVNHHEYYDNSDDTKNYNINGSVNPTQLNGSGFDVDVNGAVGTVVSNHTVNNNLSEGLETSSYNVNVKTGETGLSGSNYGISNNLGTVVNNGSTEHSGTICKNSGTVNTNTDQGKIEANYGTIILNHGRVKNNEGSGTVTTNDSDGVIITNNGTVGTNKGSFKSNSGTLTTNDTSGKIETNFSIITTNKGSVETNFSRGTIKTNDSGSVKENDGTVEDNKGTITYNYSVVDKNDTTGTVTKNFKYISDNSGIVELNYFGSDRSFGYIYNNNDTIKDNYGLVWSNNTNGTIEKNHIESAEYTGIIFYNNGKMVNNGSIVNNNLNDTTGYSLDNTKGTIVNNYGTVKETQVTAAPTTSPTDPGATPTPTPGFISAGTIINNYGTVEFDKHEDTAYVKNNYGKLINAKEVSDINGTKYMDAGTSGGKTYYGVTVASNAIKYGVIIKNENVIEGNSTYDIARDNILGEYITNTTSTSKTFYQWRDALHGDTQYNETQAGAIVVDPINQSYWLYPVYDLNSTANNVYNTSVIHTNEGNISTNETSGVVEENKSIVSLNYGTVTFDGTDDTDATETKYGYKSYVETNYGTLNNAKAVDISYDKDGKITTVQEDIVTTKTVYVDAGAGAATEKLYAITYSRNGILSEDFLNAIDKNYADSTQYVEGKGNVLSSSIWQTTTDTSKGFTEDSDQTQITYKLLDGNGKNDKGESLSINQCKENYVVDSFLYWIDVLDNNKIYNYGEISELSRSEITKAMWLRPVYSGHQYQPVEPGPGGGGSTGGGSTGGNETPAILTDIPTNTPMTAGDILNDPNMTPETKELLNEILDKNSTGSIIIKEDGTIAVPGPGGIPVDVTIEDDKVTLGTMTKDDIKKAVDSLKNSDSGKTNDKTDDKKDGKTDTKDNSNPKTNKAISIDVSVFKGIGQVEVNSDTLNNIAESDAEGLKTTMSIGSMTLDKSAITGVSGILMGRNLILVVEEMDEGLLSKKQKKVVEESKEDENYLAVVDSYLLASNDKIKNLGNGKAILEIKLDALGYKEAAGKAPVVYEIAEDGTKTKIDYEIVDHIITFEVNELSTYLITVE